MLEHEIRHLFKAFVRNQFARLIDLGQLTGRKVSQLGIGAHAALAPDKFVGRAAGDQAFFKCARAVAVHKADARRIHAQPGGDQRHVQALAADVIAAGNNAIKAAIGETFDLREAVNTGIERYCCNHSILLNISS